MEIKCEFCNSRDLIPTAQGIFCIKCQVKQRASKNYPILKVLNRLNWFHQPYLNKFWSKDFTTLNISDILKYEYRLKHPEIEEKLRQKIEESKKKKIEKYKDEKPLKKIIERITEESIKITIGCLKCSKVNIFYISVEEISDTESFHALCSKCGFKFIFSKDS